MKTVSILCVAAMVSLMAVPAFADGLVVPVRPEIRISQQWAVKYHNVRIDVDNQIARVSIDQQFVNLGSGNLEVEYLFPVPPDAAIDSLTLMVDGKEMAAQLYKAEEARKIYEDIVRTKKDPALLEYVGFGMLKTRAFPLEPNKPAKVLVTYKTVCKKDRDLVQVWYPLNTEKFSAKAIEEVNVDIQIKGKADISTVYSPTHDVTVKHEGPRAVKVSYSAKNVLPANDFQVFYQESAQAVGAVLMSHQPQPDQDGYFMLLVTPSVQAARDRVTAKDVVLVFDHSGSMGEGDKLAQAKEGLKYVLKSLHREDRFAVIAYNDAVDPFSDKLLDATEANTKDAIDHVDHLDATGSTDIDAALTTAMKMWGKSADEAEKASGNPKYIIFLTDGRPTAGKTDEDTIIKDTTKANSSKVRLFAFGVGYDVNVRLLDKLVDQNGGRSDYVKPRENIEGKISSLYAKIKNPVMTKLKVEVAGVRLRDTYPREVGDLFEGDQIVLAGRYYGDDVKKIESKDGGAFNSMLKVTGMYGGSERTFEYPVSFAAPGKSWRYDFVEKIWAVRRVGYLLDQIQLNGQSKEVIDELVRLSKEYGIMTPYTSFLADERVTLNAKGDGGRALRDEADKLTKDLTRVSGAEGQMGAMNRQQLNDARQAPEATAARPTTRPAGAADGYADAKAVGGAKLYGNTDKDSYEQKKQEAAVNVRNINGQALYRRANIWVAPDAADVDLEKDKNKIQEVQRYTDEYFKLVRANTVAQNQVLASQQADEELVVKLRGQVYRIK